MLPMTTFFASEPPLLFKFTATDNPVLCFVGTPVVTAISGSGLKVMQLPLGKNRPLRVLRSVKILPGVPGGDSLPKFMVWRIVVAVSANPTFDRVSPAAVLLQKVNNGAALVA